MPQSRLLDFQVIASASRREMWVALNRTQFEFAETRAATERAIEQSRVLMAEADAIVAKR